MTFETERKDEPAGAIGFATEMWGALGGDASLLEALAFEGEGALPSAYPVTDFASGAVAAAGLAVAELASLSRGATPRVTVDRRLASYWFGWSLQPIGWTLPPAWDPVAGDYQARDGGIRLHTNAPTHRAAALSVLGAAEDRRSVARAVAAWAAEDLETAVVQAGGCAAQMRSAQAWCEHPQGRAVAAEPLVAVTQHARSGVMTWRPTAGRPLDGLKVLDLTRVLAGPVATRFLAGYGAQVLRIDPPGWDEPGVVPEVTLGKRCARLDLRVSVDRFTFERLLAQADVLVHGYRPAALEQLGYGAEVRHQLAPGLIEVTLDAYGWSGPWAERRGFDSLVQMSAGLAEGSMQWNDADKPTPLPVQALDHATGYLVAAATIRGVTRRRLNEVSTRSRLSLARTAALLMDRASSANENAFALGAAADLASNAELTTWGAGRRLKPPVRIDTAAMAWDRPACALGSSSADWLA